MAEPDPIYNQLCQALQAMAKGEADAITTNSPAKDKALTLGAQDFSDQELEASLSKQQLDNQYRRALDSAQGIEARRMISTLRQAAVLSGMEKAKRLKQRTRLQTLIWGASRSYGQGQDSGYFGLVLPTVPLQEGG